MNENEFEYEGKKMIAREAAPEARCKGCFFFTDDYCKGISGVIPNCSACSRQDGRSVIFIEKEQSNCKEETSFCKTCSSPSTPHEQKDCAKNAQCKMRYQEKLDTSEEDEFSVWAGIKYVAIECDLLLCDIYTHPCQYCAFYEKAIHRDMQSCATAVWAGLIPGCRATDRNDRRNVIFAREENAEKIKAEMAKHKKIVDEYVRAAIRCDIREYIEEKIKQQQEK